MKKCPRTVVFLDGQEKYINYFNLYKTIFSGLFLQLKILFKWQRCKKKLHIQTLIKLHLTSNVLFNYICNTQLLDHCLLAFGINTDKLFLCENSFLLFASFYTNVVDLHICMRGYIAIITSINMSFLFTKTILILKKGFLKYI